MKPRKPFHPSIRPRQSPLAHHSWASRSQSAVRIPEINFLIRHRLYRAAAGSGSVAATSGQDGSAINHATRVASYAIDTPLRPADNPGHLTPRTRAPLGTTT